MALTNLTSKDLHQISRLIERKESLAEQIAAINRELESIPSSSNGAPVAPQPRRKGKARRKRARAAAPKETALAEPRPKHGAKARKQAPAKAATQPGGRREQIIRALKGAGKEGLRVNDVAETTGISKKNVNVWFYTTGKKVPEIEQTGPGKFRWREGK